MLKLLLNPYVLLGASFAWALSTGYVGVKAHRYGVESTTLKYELALSAKERELDEIEDRARKAVEDVQRQLNAANNANGLRARELEQLEDKLQKEVASYEAELEDLAKRKPDGCKPLTADDIRRLRN